MATVVDDRRFPFVKIVLSSEPGQPLGLQDTSYFDAMRRLAKRGKFGALLDLRGLDDFAMPGPQDRIRLYEHAQEFYSEHAAVVMAVAMVYNSRVMDMLATGVGWARKQSPKDSRRSFTEMKAAEDWVLEKLDAEAVLVRPRVS